LLVYLAGFIGLLCIVVITWSLVWRYGHGEALLRVWEFCYYEYFMIHVIEYFDKLKQEGPRCL